VVQKKGDNDIVIDPLVAEEYVNFRDVTSDMLEKNDIVVLKFKNLCLDYVQKVITAAGTSFKDTFAILILTASGEEQKKLLAMAQVWEAKEEFSATQIFFEKDISTEGNFELVENIQFSVLLGRVRNFGANIPVLLESLKDTLTSFLNKLCPQNGKVAVVIGPNTSIPFIDHGSGTAWSSFKYYGDQVAVKKLNQRLMKTNVTGVVVLDKGSDQTKEASLSHAETSQGRSEFVGDIAIENKEGDLSNEAEDIYDFNDSSVNDHSLKCIKKQSSTSKY
jgi:hypothetical protein